MNFSLSDDEFEEKYGKKKGIRGKILLFNAPKPTFLIRDLQIPTEDQVIRTRIKLILHKKPR